METTLVVTMSMQDPHSGQISAATRGARNEVVDLDVVSLGEQEPTMAATSLLPLEQERRPRLD